VSVTFDRVVLPGDADSIVSFLTAHEWPYHAVSRLSAAEAAAVPVAGAEVESYWIRGDDEVVGLVRIFDLVDLDDGSPLFDLRLATPHRGRGVGGAAVRWLSEHLFSTHPGLHRIEATTRSDNAAMRTVLERSGYRLEGVFREAWKGRDGVRHDALSYAVLRREWDERA
jgi:RimJ/RimL family protein N-acetyltransferase